MNGKAAGSKGTNGKLAALAMALVISVGVAGCKTDSKKTDAPATGGSSGSTGTPAPTPAPTANQAPTISGTPPTTAKTTLLYSFQPAASDPDGDKLTFEILGKPSWATFDPGTGRLEGTPPDGSTGTFTGVQIKVSDGKETTAMPAFNISVLAPVVGTAELAWQPPTVNEDGTPLTDLSGYVIRYGKNPGALDQSVKINNPGVTMYVVENLIEGTWYFSLSSLNASGVESRPTGSVSKTIG